ncbi:hypothetical protein ACO0K7_08790 [Undibacterium sp. Ji67W]|uniref:hypothetical protein n=1 Tax=Undibacterium sp. Ji67W TaxID=3413042 RepID=UPI003BF232BF
MNSLPEHDLTWHLHTLVFEVRILMDEVENILEKLAGVSDPAMMLLRNDLAQKVNCLEQILSRITPATSTKVVSETTLNCAEQFTSASPWQALAAVGLVGMLNAYGVEQFCQKDHK